MHPIVQEDLQRISEKIGHAASLLSGKHLLITGGAGFLGSYIIGVIHWLNKNYLPSPCRVTSIDNYITGSKKTILGKIKHPYIRYIEKNVTKPLDINTKVDYLIHAAGLASPVYYQRFPLETIDAAILGVRNMLEFACQTKPKSFLLFSSSEIYGNPDPKFIPTPETFYGNVSPIGLRACYDESKRVSETISMTYHRLFQVPAKIVRPFNVYGPGMKLNDSRVIPAFLGNAISGKPLLVHSKGRQTRTFCYVSDATSGFFKVLLSGKEGEVYNVGSDDEEISMIALAKIITQLLKNKVKVQLIDYPKTYPADEPRRRCPDLKKIKTELGYTPSLNLRSGLSRTLEWFRETYFNKA